LRARKKSAPPDPVLNLALAQQAERDELLNLALLDGHWSDNPLASLTHWSAGMPSPIVEVSLVVEEAHRPGIMGPAEDDKRYLRRSRNSADRRSAKTVAKKGEGGRGNRRSH
jgi:hypothetical protein